MANATKTKATPPSAPKPKAPATKPADAQAPETAPEPRGGNSAYAPESVRNDVAEAMANLRERGFNRPDVSAATGLSDSAVWRAQNRKVHQAEVPVLMDFIEKVVKGEIAPKPRAGRKTTVADLEARIERALEVLGNEAKTAAQFRRLVDEARETLSPSA